jgi:hypothetical protein
MEGKGHRQEQGQGQRQGQILYFLYYQIDSAN